MGARLFLLDGTGCFYRSFFAIRNLSARDGTPTNAVFGFVRAVHQALAVWQPTHAAVVWDGGTPADRLALLPEYKAQRPPMPDALRAQEAPIQEFLERAGIPLIRVEHQEADDVIASLACWSGDKAAEVLIATSDKDLYQLVDDRVRLVQPAGEDRPVGPAEVFAKTGVYPGQIVEWLALTGDTVDNIAGIRGLGPKTAAKLLAAYGRLSSVWEKLDGVEPERLRSSLRENRALVERNIALVRLRNDIPCAVDWEAMRVRPEKAESMRPFYERMEFHSLLKTLSQPELL